MKYIIMILTPVMCLYFVYKTLIALAVNASRISREEEYTSFKVSTQRKLPALIVIAMILITVSVRCHPSTVPMPVPV